MMTREEAIERIALAEYRWGLQRDIFLRDRQGREMDRDAALDVLRLWAGRLPESTFRDYAQAHAPEYLTGTP